MNFDFCLKPKQQSVPPVMAFHMGSLGFLTPFEFDNFQEQVSNVLEGMDPIIGDFQFLYNLVNCLNCVLRSGSSHSEKSTSVSNRTQE